MCSRLPVDTTNAKIKWNGVADPLILLFAVDDREPFLRQSMESGEWIDVELSHNNTKVFFKFSRVNLFEFYAGRGANFTAAYPPGAIARIVGTGRNYNRERCLDAYYLEQSPAPPGCKEKYYQLFRAMNDVKGNDGAGYGASGIWTDVSRLNCSWKIPDNFAQFPLVECGGCDPMNGIEREVLAHGRSVCQQNHFHAEYDFEKEVHVKPGGRKAFYTRIMLKAKPIKVVKTKQYHAMTTTDLFSQVGGFLGLLVGASVITILEFLEFFFNAVGGSVKACVAKRKRKTGSSGSKQTS